MTAPAWFRDLVDEYVASVRGIRRIPDMLPEPSLHVPLDGLLNGFLRQHGGGAKAAQQVRTDFGIPDFVVDATGPIGYIEAKQPAVDLSRLNSRDAAQQASFRNLPNLVYTNYRDFVLFQEGEQVAEVSLGGRTLLSSASRDQIAAGDADHLYDLLGRFAAHRIQPPTTAEELAEALARAARVLHDATRTVLRVAPDGSLATLRDQWRHLLFDESDDAEFADAYAQTVAYGLLTARLESDADLSVEKALAVVEERHEFLGAALWLLTHPAAVKEVRWAVEAVVQTVAGVSPEVFRSKQLRQDPLLYFYEHFLARYDAPLRRRRGVYYTPAALVQFQVRAVADLIASYGHPTLLADEAVLALDPAAGTGTYLLALLDESVARAVEAHGSGAQAAAADAAANRLNGFELLVGPYTVAHQRLGIRLRELGAGQAPVRVYLTDTLAAADAAPSGQLSLLEKPLVEERAQADHVKHSAPVMVVIGNPPYSRGRGRAPSDWLQQQMSYFTDPVRGKARRNLKNLADDYAYFFRWALWKLFEGKPSGPRLLSFVTNRSYLGGDAFEGIRLRLRELFDDIWIVDIGGDTRGQTPDPNIFDIRVGVAVVVGARRSAGQPKAGLATVRYTRLRGTRDEKEQALGNTVAGLPWEDVPGQAGEPFLPPPDDVWTAWPAIDDLMPARQSGIETQRDALVVGVTQRDLAEKLDQFADPSLSSAARRAFFHETRGRPCPSPSWSQEWVRKYGYRPLDARWLYDADSFIDFPRPKLHQLWHKGQRAFVSLPKGHGGRGPAVFQVAHIPDRHAYRGSYGGHVFPLWLDSAHTQPNLAAAVLRQLRLHLGGDIEPAEVFSYVYAVLQAPSYAARYVEALDQGFPRIPFTADRVLFNLGAELGGKLQRIHAFEEPKRTVKLVGQAGPIGDAEWAGRKVSLGGGMAMEPVSEAAWTFAVSGYRILPRWLRDRKGLHLGHEYDVMTEMLAVASAVEATVRLGPRLDRLLEEVVSGPIL